MNTLRACAPSQMVRGSEVQRLLLVADAAVCEVRELPPAARAMIDCATEIYVVTPTLPGRLAWLADDVDRFRHLADERLDTVLDHMRSIGADAQGVAGRGSVLTVIADAVAAFAPSHILVALRSSEHANWQERHLVEHIEDRFGLPVTTYAVDVQGHTASADGPLLLCYDGSEDAAHAIKRAGELFAGRRALVLMVWHQPVAALGGIAWSGESPNMADVPGFDREVAENAGRVADDGVRLAERAGLLAEPLAVQGSGAVSKTILELAERYDAAAIIMGSRGLTGMRSRLLGSVSSAVVGHAGRPTLVMRHSVPA